ncbi:RsmE family RNA methyltransferase [Liquorilactobacillus sicerae]|uniref:RsmE family RNA methyltransferase n=1 Tax=Liquorilactobacillus sicerae TaxID=1416943 RepID=UPI0024804B84|nr:16S rRNA (uracil(1498)-N(3))-methyltransferase [Liquorilactobacillus sicerae]
MQRYFTKLSEVPADYQLEPQIFHHAIKVLRDKEGQMFELVDQQQRVKLMKLTRVFADQAFAKTLKTSQPQVELPVKITILAGLIKNSKPDLLIQKATELGAASIIFFNADFSVAQWNEQKASKKLGRLQKIAQGAAEQSHRTQVPLINFVTELKKFDFSKYQYRVAAYEESAKQGEKQALPLIIQKIRQQLTKQQTRPTLVAVFGPEGGLSLAEVAYLQQQRCYLAGLGPRIMRAETAPWYLLATLSFALELG